jgi:hypothetical protein
VIVRHLTRRIPALADSFATLRGFVLRVRSPEGHLTPIRTLQPLSRSVIGARSPAPIVRFEFARARTLPARSILSGTAGNLQDRAIAPSRLVPLPASGTDGQTWRTGDSATCRGPRPR